MAYSTIDGKVINDAGEIAVAYYQTIPHVVTVYNYGYAFTVNANICMAWIKPEHLDSVLDIVKRCCGNNSKHVYRLEHEAHVRRWLGEASR